MAIPVASSEDKLLSEAEISAQISLFKYFMKSEPDGGHKLSDR